MKKKIAFCGAGLSSLMTLYFLTKLKDFSDLEICLIDSEQKNKNDRTFCFWEEENGEFDEIVSKKWNKIQFSSVDFSKEFLIEPYFYKMIHAADFYAFMWNHFSKFPNISFIKDTIQKIEKVENQQKITCLEQNLNVDLVFNSILKINEIPTKKFPLLKQHFVGFVIKTNAPILDDSKATFMDFNIEQKGNTRFMYILPQSKNEALFEYTLFSENELNYSEYEYEILDYLKQKKIENFTISHIEKGVIPMTSYPFWKKNTETLIHIGSAGGWTKASTGFTFFNAQKNAKIIAQNFNKKSLKQTNQKFKFWFYDFVFITVLSKHNHLGSTIFTAIFKKNNPISVLRFLEEKSTFREELKIILACPKRIFIISLFIGIKRLLLIKISIINFLNYNILVL